MAKRLTALLPRRERGRVVSALAALVSTAANAATPLADMHLHYTWSQAEVTSPRDALAALDANDVQLALVTGIPPQQALRLADAAPDRIIPALGIYRHSAQEKSRWSFDPAVLAYARTALASGRYRAIGEVHMIPGFMAKPDTPVVQGLLALAAEHRVPFWLHTEFSDPSFMIRLCQTHPQVTFLWAHAGSVLNPRQVGQALAACPRLWLELAARDPWRHHAERITDATGRLKPAWRALILRYADRTVIGSDPVWPVTQLDSWDEPDTGWHHVDDFLQFHRRWLDDLPAPIARRIRLDNALRLFGHAQP